MAVNMVSFTTKLATGAALSLMLSLTSALPSMEEKRNIAIPSIWMSEVTTANTLQGPAPEVVTVSVEELSANSTTTAAPSWFPDAPTVLRDRNIIGGADDRVLWTDTDYPYTAMGRIERSDGFVCTGSLIGPRHVATARHCVLPQKGQSTPVIKFQPNYYDGERLGHAFASVLYYLPTDAEPTTTSSDPCFWKEDWAIIILDDRLGEKYGYLGAKLVDPGSQLNKPEFFNLGYPADKSNTQRPWRQEDISVLQSSKCDSTGPLDTDADTSPGNSGGPLWLLENGDRYQYAMFSALYSDHSSHSGGNNWLSAVVTARGDYP